MAGTRDIFAAAMKAQAQALKKADAEQARKDKAAAEREKVRKARKAKEGCINTVMLSASLASGVREYVLNEDILLMFIGWNAEFRELIEKGDAQTKARLIAKGSAFRGGDAGSPTANIAGNRRSNAGTGNAGADEADIGPENPLEEG